MFTSFSAVARIIDDNEYFFAALATLMFTSLRPLVASYRLLRGSVRGSIFTIVTFGRLSMKSSGFNRSVLARFLRPGAPGPV